MANWDKVTIGDLCSSVSTTYKGHDKEVVLVNTSDVLDGSILNHKKVCNQNLKGQFKKTFQKDDILYSEIRPANKRFAYIDFDNTDQYIASTKLMVLRPDKEKVLPRFLFEILKSKSVIEHLQHLAETRSGTFPQITFSSELAPMEVLLPDFATQTRIVDILTKLENKMLVNTNINQNLVRQAQALFRSWFVNFDPFGGTIPNDWVYGTIADLAQNIICGKTPSTKKDEYYGNDIPFITIPDMHNSIYIVKTERYLSSLGASSQSNKTLVKNSICVSCIGTAGLVSLVSEESQTNQQINSIVPKKGFSPFYIYLLMRTLPETINKLGQSGSTIVNLNKAQFSKITALIPTETIMKSFDDLLLPLFECILNNQKQNEKLSKLRDTLLPRLMSGELDVSGIDI